jgi:hypothetical protein
MDNTTRSRPNKLDRDLGLHQVLSRLVKLLLLAGFCLLAYRLSVWTYNEAVPYWFAPTSILFTILLCITSGLMATNFGKIDAVRADLRDQAKKAEQQADLLDLLKPMLADAFRLDPDRIKPALVERFIERVIDELTNDYSAASRNFLQQQPLVVKDLVRSRCTEILKSRQEELELHLHTARQGARLMPQHEIELLVDAMAKARGVLNLIPDRFPDSDIPKPAGARIVPEPTPYHVAEANS